jgi:cellulose synthase/poly-beta-1,6-N-acetylglucosamine synthase-like glycosyltransferase
MLTAFHSVLYATDWFFFWYFIALNSIYMVLLAVAAKAMLEYKNQREVRRGVPLPEEFMKPFSVVVPAFNEEATIVQSVKAMLELDYPEYEVIVCDDGSTDNTIEYLTAEFGLEEVDVESQERYPCGPINKVYFSHQYPDLVVVTKENEGKPGALNAAANFARYPYLCAVDADSLLSSDSMEKLMQMFTAVPSTAAVGGVVRIANGALVKDGRIEKLEMPDTFTERIQILEYFRAFLFGRLGLSKLNALMIISGAFGVFRQDMLEKIHGWDLNSIGEDMEMVVRLQRYINENKSPLRIAFAPDPVSWTQVPDTLSELSVQRDRWQRALTQSLMKNMSLMFNPRYKAIGMFAFPFYFIFEFVGAAIEFLGYPIVVVSFILGVIDLKFFALFAAVALLWGLFISIASLALAELSYRRYEGRYALWQLIQAAIYENFGYRQMHAFWRFKGMVRYLFGRRSGWGEQSRRSFRTEEEASHE